MKQIILLLVTILLLAPCQSKASLSDTVRCEGDFSVEAFSTILQQLHLKCEDCDLDYVVEQAMPKNPNLSIWIIPQNVTTADKNCCSSTVYHILLVDGETKQIVSRYNKPHIFDAYCGFAQVRVDEDLYQLNDKTTAFKIMGEYGNNSRLYPQKNTDILLFIVQGNTLHKVLIALLILIVASGTTTAKANGQAKKNH